VSLGRSQPSCYKPSDPELLVAESTEKAGVGSSTPSLATTFQKDLTQSHIALSVRSQSALVRRNTQIRNQHCSHRALCPACTARDIADFTVFPVIRLPAPPISRRDEEEEYKKCCVRNSSSSRRCGKCEPKVQGSVGKPFFGFSTDPSVSTTLFATKTWVTLLT